MRWIHWTCLLAFAALLQPDALPAQAFSGYAVAGIGSRDGKLTSQGAVGVERSFFRGAGISGEIGAVMGHNSFAVLSLNGYYQPPAADSSKVNPFVSGGYTAGVLA